MDVASTSPLRIYVKFSIAKRSRSRNSNGETDLHIACNKKQYTTALYLMTRGADMNVVDNAGWSPLHEAVIANNIKTVDMLLTCGADVNIVGCNYSTPLHIAIYHEVHLDIIRLLVKYGADFSARNIFGQTPIDIAPNSLATMMKTMEIDTVIRRFLVLPRPRIHCESQIHFNFFRRLFSDIGFYSERNYFLYGNTTHLVVADKNSLNMKKIYAAMLQGSIVIEWQRMEGFMKADRDTFNPMHYVLDIPEFAVQKSVWNKLRQRPKLFNNVFFCFCNNSRKWSNISTTDDFSMHELKCLIRLGDGKVLNSLPDKPFGGYYYPYHSNGIGKQSKVMCYVLCNNPFHDMVFTQRTIMHKPVAWFLECIRNFEINN